jgi:hypothetical protein
VAALTGVASDGVGEGGYLLDELQYVLLRVQPHASQRAMDVPFECNSPDSQTGQTILCEWDAIIRFLLSGLVEDTLGSPKIPSRHIP